MWLFGNLRDTGEEIEVLGWQSPPNTPISFLTTAIPRETPWLYHYRLTHNFEGLAKMDGGAMLRHPFLPSSPHPSRGGAENYR
jgi:hypothetical protein